MGGADFFWGVCARTNPPFHNGLAARRARFAQSIKISMPARNIRPYTDILLKLELRCHLPEQVIFL